MEFVLFGVKPHLGPCQIGWWRWSLHWEWWLLAAGSSAPHCLAFIARWSGCLAARLPFGRRLLGESGSESAAGTEGSQCWGCLDMLHNHVGEAGFDSLTTTSAEDREPRGQTMSMAWSYWASRVSLLVISPHLSSARGWMRATSLSHSVYLSGLLPSIASLQTLASTRRNPQHKVVGYQAHQFLSSVGLAASSQRKLHCRSSWSNVSTVCQYKSLAARPWCTKASEQWFCFSRRFDAGTLWNWDVSWSAFPGSWQELRAGWQQTSNVYLKVKTEFAWATRTVDSRTGLVSWYSGWHPWCTGIHSWPSSQR